MTNDPFFTTEADAMNRAFDPSNTDVADTADPALGGALTTSAIPPPVPTPGIAMPRRAGTSNHAICPFCATVNEAAGICRQCGMENTPSTRQATRGKIGPWFVWQARNPAAPGMNWATLMSLVSKGRITPRSIVRGPTTGQLWRYAARVKGLSREFGSCWHCGGEVKSTARLCPMCKRMQQPPINPDVLLESDVQKTPLPQALTDPRRGGLLSLVPDPVRREVSPQAIRAHTSSLPLESSGELPATRSLQAIDAGEDSAPTGMELRAFQLPADYAIGARPNRGIYRPLILAAMVALIAMVVAFASEPKIRPQWFNAWMSKTSGPNGRQLQVPADASDAAHQPAGNDRPVVSAASPLHTPLMSVPNDSSRPDAKVPLQMIVSPGRTSMEPATKPAQVGGVDVTDKNTAAPASAVSSIQVTGPPNDPQATERRAWELYDRAIKSEQREDYGGAVKEYEWIDQLRLPDGVGPSDVQTRLDRARKLLHERSR